VHEAEEFMAQSVVQGGHFQALPPSIATPLMAVVVVCGREP
jgi:hypothetical protein